MGPRILWGVSVPAASPGTPRDVPALLERLVGTRWRRLQWLPTVDSTNRFVRDAALAGAAAGLVVVADHQSAGRGRRDRRWDAAPGAALLVSVLVRSVDGFAATAAAAVAMADAVRAVAGVEALVKWPNDLVVGERKLVGVLAETGDGAVVLGAGCNVARGSLPAELRDTATTCGDEAPDGRSVNRDDLLVAYLGALDVRLADPEGTRGEWIARSATLGRRVRVELVDATVEGVARELASDGRLVVDLDGGGQVVVSAGDVVHVR